MVPHSKVVFHLELNQNGVCQLSWLDLQLFVSGTPPTTWQFKNSMYYITIATLKITHQCGSNRTSRKTYYDPESFGGSLSWSIYPAPHYANQIKTSLFQTLTERSPGNLKQGHLYPQLQYFFTKERNKWITTDDMEIQGCSEITRRFPAFKSSCLREETAEWGRTWADAIGKTPKIYIYNSNAKNN